MFYNLLDDGNGDDLSLHAALPVKEGNLILKNKTLLNLVLVPILSYFALPCLSYLTCMERREMVSQFVAMGLID